MVYSAQLASALSGASLGQLAYWRSSRDGQPPLLAPEFGRRPVVGYSFRDVVALRMFTKLREAVSLQKIRKAVTYLGDNHPSTHLSAHRLAARPGGRSVVWISNDGDYFDIVERPGQTGFKVVMDDIFGSFRVGPDRNVPDFGNPAAGITIDSEVRGGYPVAEGTRIPYHVVAGLRRDGLTDDQIRELYPSVSVHSIQGAYALGQMVDTSVQRVA
jgi:uncharacterized protein (DUF433 family)